jgi:hypothetical protein
MLGTTDGAFAGRNEGEAVGLVLGAIDGDTVGGVDVESDGRALGSIDGAEEIDGWELGDSVTGAIWQDPSFSDTSG